MNYVNKVIGTLVMLNRCYKPIVVILLAERCKCIAKFGYCHALLSVDLSSVCLSRAYCDETAEARITRFSSKSS